MAKAAAEGNHPDDVVPDELRWDQPVPHGKGGDGERLTDSDGADLEPHRRPSAKV